MSMNIQEFQTVGIRMPCTTIRAVKAVALRRGMVKPSGRANFSEAIRHLVEVALQTASSEEQENDSHDQT